MWEKCPLISGPPVVASSGPLTAYPAAISLPVYWLCGIRFLCVLTRGKASRRERGTVSRDGQDLVKGHRSWAKWLREVLGACVLKSMYKSGSVVQGGGGWWFGWW